jgi:RNA polymerase sigma factor (sigma-70 family)
MPAIAATALDALAREARRHHLLTASEEIELSRRVQRGMQPDSTPKELRSAKRARERMINANLLLVIKNAAGIRKRIAGTILDVEDLCQAGIIGLNRAVDKFDAEKGYKFSTYATWWIRQALTKELAANRGTIKTSTEAQAIARRWRYRPAWQTLDAFCEEFDYTREKVERVLFQYQRAQCTSLDKVQNNGDGSSLVELLADEEQPDLDSLHYAMLMEQLEAAPETRDAIAALQLAETAQHKEMADLLGVRPKQVPQRLEDFKAVVREHLINPSCDNATSQPEFMTATAPTSNGHARLERLIEDVQSEAEPVAAPKAKRTRRTRAEIESANAEKSANTVKQPVLVTLIIGGQEVTGTPGAIAAVMSALPARAVA